jgi:hypothetical protein
MKRQITARCLNLHGEVNTPLHHTKQNTTGVGQYQFRVYTKLIDNTDFSKSTTKPLIPVPLRTIVLALFDVRHIYLLEILRSK